MLGYLASEFRAAALLLWRCLVALDARFIATPPPKRTERLCDPSHPTLFRPGLAARAGRGAFSLLLPFLFYFPVFLLFSCRPVNRISSPPCEKEARAAVGRHGTHTAARCGAAEFGQSFSVVVGRSPMAQSCCPSAGNDELGRVCMISAQGLQLFGRHPIAAAADSVIPSCL